MTSLTDERLSDRLMDRRIVVLGDEVTDESANRIVSQLLVLSADDDESDICLYINSPGGSVLAGLAIYDVMQLVPNDVSTVAIGLAASMGQVLLCGGTAGKRYALPNAQVLMHEGSAGLGGTAADVEIQAAHLVATLDRMRSIIAVSHRPPARPGDRRRGPRPLVRRRGRNGVRLRRSRRVVARRDPPDLTPSRRRPGRSVGVSSYTIPSVVEATARGERVTDIYSRLLSERIVFLGTPIDDGVANVVIAQMLHLAADKPSSDVHLYLNSPGGSFTAMMAIYDTMRFIAPDVATICVGQACLGGGDPVWPPALPANGPCWNTRVSCCSSPTPRGGGAR